MTHEQHWILNTHNFLLPGGSGRRIYDIPTNQLQPFPDMLENGHAAYQIGLPNLEPILETSTFLTDRITGQFHTIYDDGYKGRATTRKLLHPWQKGELLAKLNETL